MAASTGNHRTISITKVQGGYNISDVLTKHAKRERNVRHKRHVSGEVLQDRHELRPSVGHSVGRIDLRTRSSRRHTTCTPSIRGVIMF